MTRKQRRIKLAQRRYHRADSLRKYWARYGQPRSVMEQLRPTIILPADQIGLNINLRSPYIPFDQFVQTLFPITPMRVKG